MVTASQIEAAANVEADRKYSVLVDGDWLECDVQRGVKWSYAGRRVTPAWADTILRSRPNLKLWTA